MKLHKGCITDPLIQAWWREFRVKQREGYDRPFYEYVIGRAMSIQPIVVTIQATEADPWIAANCGHQHPFGSSCSTWAGDS